MAARVLFRPDHPHPAFELFHSGDLWSVLLVGLTAVILAPVLEELLFRGLLLSGLSPLVGPWTAILLTGTLFGLAHTSVLAGPHSADGAGHCSWIGDVSDGIPLDPDFLSRIL